MAAKRRTKVEMAAERHVAAVRLAERLANMLASAPSEGDGTLAAPAFIHDERLKPALIVWRELAPHLERSGRLHAIDRDMFAALCYWRAEWIAGVDDIAVNGYAIMGKSTTGAPRPWTNPSVDRRDTAWAQMVALSAKFGLTPLDRIALNRASKTGDLDDADLFDGTAKKEPKHSEDTVVPGKWDDLDDQAIPVVLN